jgi:hypothetical protein
MLLTIAGLSIIKGYNVFHEKIHTKIVISNQIHISNVILEDGKKAQWYYRLQRAILDDVQQSGFPFVLSRPRVGALEQ